MSWAASAGRKLNVWILKSAAKAAALLFASSVLWGVVSVVWGGGMLTSDPVVREWVGRASGWMIVAMILTPLFLDALQRRVPLSRIQRGGLAFILIALPFQLGLALRPEALTLRPEHFTVSKFHAVWAGGGILVAAGLALLAERLTRPPQIEVP